MNEELFLKLYETYTNQKERFIERNFLTNKFYLILSLVLIFLIFLHKDLVFYKNVSLPIVYGLIGMLICALWWINIDSYNFLIKIKYTKIIEEMEKQLPYQPYTNESKAITDYRKNKKAFLFSDIQKLLAILSFLTFFVMFLVKFIPTIVRQF